MHFKELMKSRYSVRSYHENKVDRTLLKQVVDAGIMAPSAANRQPLKFVVIDDDKILEKIQLAYPRDWFYRAPNLIVIYGNHQTSWKRAFDNKDHCDIDAAIATDHITLMAADLGLGTCWVCNFDPQIMNKALPCDDGWEPIVILTIGYPTENKIPDKKRKSLDEMLSFNGW